MVIEILTEVAVGFCKHCGYKIKKMQGDLGSVNWYHDSTGKQYCPNSTLAEPSEHPLEKVDPESVYPYGHELWCAMLFVAGDGECDCK